MKPGLFSNKSFSVKTVFFLFLIIAGFCFTMLALMIMLLISNPEAILSGKMPELSAQMLRIIQTFQSFFVFIIPALLCAWFFSNNPNEYLYFEKKNTFFVFVFVIIACIAVIPFINWLAYINEQMSFPDALSGLEQKMRESETAAQKVMTTMLQTDSVITLLYNILLVGVLAAVGEELLFRGIIQRLITDASKNIHIGIWVSAFIFSSIHFQFYGFFPRLLLGAWFGYLLYWSRSLWLPILAHFVNNATAVVISYLQQHGFVDLQTDTIGKGDAVLSGISVIVFGIFMLIIYRFTKKT